METVKEGDPRYDILRYIPSSCLTAAGVEEINEEDAEGKYGGTYFRRPIQTVREIGNIVKVCHQLGDESDYNFEYDEFEDLNIGRPENGPVKIHEEERDQFIALVNSLPLPVNYAWNPDADHHCPTSWRILCATGRNPDVEIEFKEMGCWVHVWLKENVITKRYQGGGGAWMYPLVLCNEIR